jgi:hypothetical protein
MTQAACDFDSDEIVAWTEARRWPSGIEDFNDLILPWPPPAFFDYTLPPVLQEAFIVFSYVIRS